MTDTNRPWGIHTIHDMIGSADCQTPQGRAVPMPYLGTFWDRLTAAWWVMRGRAYAVRWPEAGDMEAAVGFPARKPGARKGGA